MHTIIVGGGLGGLFLAHRLHLAGHQVTLLEARERLGGKYRRPSLTLPYSSPTLDFVPATRDYLALLEWLKNLSPVPVNFTLHDHHPQIFSDGKWMPFAGFGSVGFASVGELSALFSHTQGVDLQPGMEHIVRALVEQLPITAQTMAEVTAIRVSDGRVTGVVINGDKELSAHNVVFTPHPTHLNNLIAGAELPVKYRTRLGKMQLWTAVTLALTHNPPLIDDTSVRLFTHNAKEFEPVVGRVFQQHSKWLTLVPESRASEHEFVGQCIRHIKRQLKRAWPLALADTALANANANLETIYVQAQAYGQHVLSRKVAYRIPEIANLYMANHGLSALPGEWGALEAVKALESELCGPLNKLPELGASC